jgi:hypothetical protein
VQEIIMAMAASQYDASLAGHQFSSKIYILGCSAFGWLLAFGAMALGTAASGTILLGVIPGFLTYHFLRRAHAQLSYIEVPAIPSRPSADLRLFGDLSALKTAVSRARDSGRILHLMHPENGPGRGVAAGVINYCRLQGVACVATPGATDERFQFGILPKAAEVVTIRRWRRDVLDEEVGRLIRENWSPVGRVSRSSFCWIGGRYAQVLVRFPRA